METCKFLAIPKDHIDNLVYNNEKNTTLPKQFQYFMENSQKKLKSIPLTQKYMTAHCAGVEQALQ